jgi:hypothetical protein
MKITTNPPASANRPTPDGSATPAATTGAGAAHCPAPTARASGPQAVTLFQVTFATEMSERDLAILALELNLSTNVRSKTNLREDNLGFVRLDHASGLFLRRAMIEGRWMLDAHTWGHPPPQVVHGWEVLAAGAARRLDPAVTLPDRLPVSSRDIPDRQVDRDVTKRLERIRRHLVGLP